MFHLGYNLYRFLKTSRDRNVNLVMVGLDNAGKTSILSCTKGKVPTDVAPTFGFSREVSKRGRHALTVYDLSGGANLRGIWSHYFADVHGIVYVVDASDKDRLQESKEALYTVLDSDYVAKKPLLMYVGLVSLFGCTKHRFANKQDIETAFSSVELAEELQLAEKCSSSFHFAECCALMPDGTIDPRIDRGLAWLISSIEESWQQLRPRVKQDTALQKQKEQQAKKERAQELRRIRAERKTDTGDSVVEMAPSPEHPQVGLSKDKMDYGVQKPQPSQKQLFGQTPMEGAWDDDKSAIESPPKIPHDSPKMGEWIEESLPNAVVISPSDQAADGLAKTPSRKL